MPLIQSPRRLLGVDSADLDGDGDLDLVHIETNIGFTLSAYYHLNDGSGGFGPRTRLGQVDRPLTGLAMENIDGDSLPDAIATTLPEEDPQWSSEAFVYRNLTLSGATGANRFLDPKSISESYGEGPILVAGFNQDGHDDLVVHRVLNATSVAVKINTGQGRFLRATELVDLAPIAETIQRGASVGDVNGDRFLDIAFVEPDPGPGSARIGAIYGDGQGGFSAAEFHVVDLDQDSTLDVLIVAGNEVRLSAGCPGGSFKIQALLIQLPWVATSSAVGDFDGDGLTDLFVMNSPNFIGTPSQALTFLGVPGGVFFPTRQASPMKYPAPIRFAQWT